MRRILNWLLSGPNGSTGPSEITARVLVIEVLAGGVASVVTIAHCLSYSALIFSGELSSGLAMGLWSFLLATTIGCLVTSALSSLTPALAGPRNPSVAVMSVLAATVATSATAAGLPPAAAVAHVLAALSLATLLTALAMGTLGALRLGQIVRFIPHPVVAGFLAASGWLLIAGGIKVALARPLAFPTLASLTLSEIFRLCLAMAFAGLIIGSRRFGIGTTFLPILFVAGSVLIDLSLAWLGANPGWFLANSAGTSPWSPPALLASGLDWTIIARAHVEIISIVGVAAIALLLDASALEAQRRTNADMNTEFKVGGIANLTLASLGGFVVALAPNSSRLIDEMGGRRRLASIVGGLVVGAALASGINLAGFVPTPVLGGLLIYLGYSVLADALWNAPARGSLPELALTLGIAGSIVQFGYLTGIILGLVGACVLFAARYSRIDAVHRHITRSEFASSAERDTDATAMLRREGGRIHIFWLNGFIFFGSSNRIFELIRDAITAPISPPRRWVVLELSRVSGLDSSALLSFSKLATWAQSQNVALVVAGASAELGAEFQRARPSEAIATFETFATRSEALEWCEEQLLTLEATPIGDTPELAFRTWLARELGQSASQRLVERHLLRRALAPGETLCRQGDPSGSMELIASGSVAIVYADAQGRQFRLRRMTNRTVVGEMGFFRGVQRGASVVAETASVAYVLERAAYDALVQSDPDLAKALLEFVVRALADRISFTNTEIAALV